MIHRRGQILELGEARACLLVERAAAGGVEADHALDHADHLARALRRVVVRAEQIERVVAHRLRRRRRGHRALEQLRALLVVIGLAEQRLGGRQRTLRIVEVVEVDLRDARAGALAILLGLALEAALPEPDQIGPPLVPLEQALEALAHLTVIRREGQQRLVVLDGLVGLVRDILRELRGLAEQADAPRLVARDADGAVVEPERVLPSLGARVQHGEALQRGVGRGGEHGDAAEDPLEDGRIVAEPRVAEGGGAIADHLGDLRFEVCRQRLAIQRHDIVGTVELRGELLHLFPRADAVRRMFDGSSSFLQRGEVGHAEKNSS